MLVDCFRGEEEEGEEAVAVLPALDEAVGLPEAEKINKICVLGNQIEGDPQPSKPKS